MKKQIYINITQISHDHICLSPPVPRSLKKEKKKEKSETRSSSCIAQEQLGLFSRCHVRMHRVQIEIQRGIDRDATKFHGTGSMPRTGEPGCSCEQKYHRGILHSFLVRYGA